MNFNRDQVVLSLKALGGSLAGIGAVLTALQETFAHNAQVDLWIMCGGILIHGLATAVNEVLKLLVAPTADEAAPGVPLEKK